MYIAATDPISGQKLCINIKLEVLDYMRFGDYQESHRYVVKNIQVTETRTLEMFAEYIKRILLSAGKFPENLEQVLVDSFGISEDAIPKLVEYMFPSNNALI